MYKHQASETFSKLLSCVNTSDSRLSLDYLSVVAESETVLIFHLLHNVLDLADQYIWCEGWVHCNLTPLSHFLNKSKRFLGPQAGNSKVVGSLSRLSLRSWKNHISRILKSLSSGFEEKRRKQFLDVLSGFPFSLLIAGENKRSK